MSPIDDLLKFVSSWPWYNFVMLVIAVASILLNILLYLRGKTERSPSYAMLSTSIIRNIKSLEDLQVLYRGQQTENVTVTNVMFWNAGRDTISDGVTVEPLAIKAKSGHRILDARKVQENNPPSQFNVARKEDGSAEVRFKYVDNNQGVVVQVVHDGKSSRDLEVTGAFMRAPKLSRREIEASAVQSRKQILSLIGLMAVLYAIVLFQMLISGNFSAAVFPTVFLLLFALMSLFVLKRRVPKGLEAFVEPLSLGETKRKTWVELIKERLKKSKK